jgi:glycerophosphoryl diester phosphodiesterase
MAMVLPPSIRGKSWRSSTPVRGATRLSQASACRRSQMRPPAANGIAANIEIKPCPGRDVITGQLVAGAALALWQDQTPPPLLSSFSFEALAAAREAAPTLPRGMLFEAVPDDWLRIVRELECVSLHASHKHLTAERVAEIRAQGLRVLVYTVNDPDRARLLAQWGVDMICTDRIDMLAHDMLSTSGNRA